MRVILNERRLALPLSIYDSEDLKPRCSVSDRVIRGLGTVASDFYRKLRCRMRREYFSAARFPVRVMFTAGGRREGTSVSPRLSSFAYFGSFVVKKF